MEEEAGVAPDIEGMEDMANIDTFYCCWGVSNFAKVLTLYFVWNNLGFSVFAGVFFKLSAYECFSLRGVRVSL